jgi:hypothetical protein
MNYLTMNALKVRVLTLSSPILRCEVLSQSLSILTGMEEVFFSNEIAKANTAMFSFARPRSERGKLS